ncbi:hypothetical protein E2C01_075244 [Portunus trituberculatus]|uniref:Uncharacterized protein n=1 Tax=Portunus trituberculatus TaxID=210409 RepID=A0A5B7IIM5_PORTR|nr:hypothetical protein [Portunus trituberculatus]
MQSPAGRQVSNSHSLPRIKTRKRQAVSSQTSDTRCIPNQSDSFPSPKSQPNRPLPILHLTIFTSFSSSSSSSSLPSSLFLISFSVQFLSCYSVNLSSP